MRDVSSANAFDFLLGDWDLDMEVVPEGASIGRRATMRASRFLDGKAILDEWRHFDREGVNVIFRGAGFRTFVPGTDRWHVHWMMAETEGYSELDASLVDGELRTTGRGRDAGGELVERGRYFDISARSRSRWNAPMMLAPRGPVRSCRSALHAVQGLREMVERADAGARA